MWIKYVEFLEKKTTTKKETEGFVATVRLLVVFFNHC